MKVRTLFEMRPDSSEFKRLDPPNKWLALYTYDPRNKHPSSEIIAKLLKRYPAQAGVIYRGINFDTKAQYQTFMEEIQDGVMKTRRVTSWTQSEDQSEQFAITQPSYQLSLSTMTDYRDMQDNKETVAGYRGVILQTTIEAGQGIDVNKSKLGHESEVILPPGSYQVKIHRELKRWGEMAENGELNFNQIVLQASDDDIRKADYYDANTSVAHVLAKHGKKLNDAAKHRIFLAYSGAKFLYHRIDDGYGEYDLNTGKRMPTPKTLHIAVYSGLFDYAMKGMLTKEDAATARKIAHKAIEEACKIIMQHKDLHLETASMLQIARWAGAEDILTRTFQLTLGKKYQKLQNDVSEINKIKDPNEHRQAIDRHAKAVEKILKQIR